MEYIKVNYKLILQDNFNTLLITEKRPLEIKKGRKEEQEKYLNNLRRARREIRDIIKYNVCDGSSMVTLTYKDNMQDYNKAHNDFKNFIRRLKNPKYIQVKELQKRGAIHFHVILFDRISNKDITNAWKQGFSYIKYIEDFTELDKVSNYIGKYLADYEKGQLIKAGQRLYNCSRGLRRKQVYTLTNHEADFLLKTNNNSISISNHNYYKLVIPKKENCGNKEG